jgi:hypothetical protein
VKEVESEFLAYRYGPMDLGIPYPSMGQGDEVISKGKDAEVILVTILKESGSLKAKGYSIYCMRNIGLYNHAELIQDLYEEHEKKFRDNPDIDLSFMIGQACLYVEEVKMNSRANQQR